MATVQASSMACNASYQDHATPILFSHPCYASLGYHELGATIDFHDDIKVVFFNILNVTDASSDASIGNQNRDCLVFSGNLGISQYRRDKVPCRVPRSQICCDCDKQLTGVLFFQFGSQRICFFLDYMSDFILYFQIILAFAITLLEA